MDASQESFAHTQEWMWLISEEGQRFLKEIRVLYADGHKSETLRKHLQNTGLEPSYISTLFSQYELQQRARKKFGKIAERMLFTPSGLEQASREQLANFHAERFYKAQVPLIYDLGCGIGSQSLAFVRAKKRVCAVELDQLTACFARHNLKTVEERRESKVAEVVCADVHELAIPETAAVFFDPARRELTNRNAKRFSAANIAALRPRWDFILETVRRHGGAVKLSPAFPHEHIPQDAEALWAHCNNETSELALYFGPLRTENARFTALAFDRDGAAHTITSANPQRAAPTSPLRAYLYEPVGSLIRAQLLALFAEEHSMGVLSPHIAYLTSDSLLFSPFLHSFRVIDTVSLRLKRIQALLRKHHIGPVEVKKRGVDHDPSEIQRALSKRKNTNTREATLFLTRIAGRHSAILAERIHPHSAKQAETERAALKS